MKKKFGALLSVGLAASVMLAGCGSDTSKEAKGGKDKKDFKVAMVTDVGGVDDKSFNQSAWEGLQRFGKENGLAKDRNYKYLQSQSASDYQPNLQRLVRENYDLVYGIGYLMQADVQKVAKQKPDAHLALVDSVVENQKNVANILFKEQEGSFLVGLIAGSQTKTGKVGFIGGVTGPVIKRFENGFKAGVKTANPKAEVEVQYAEAFDKAEKGQQIANTFYDKGVDIIFPAAGATGNGVFTEAKNRAKNGKKVWVIGVDRDQYEEGLPEDVTLTSMVKKVDQAVFDVSKQTMDGKFPGGQVLNFGLKENGVGISSHKDHVTDKALKLVEEYKQKIIKGEVKVPGTDAEFKNFKVK
ncbi:BMP family protein [Fictibacillus sp. Mic-4]|uniref:BMP family lipoprotein n=1 Tax=Fictibacillus sp. Mic-4 TaxID=3132826 RepID=UPI003CF4B835